MKKISKTKAKKSSNLFRVEKVDKEVSVSIGANYDVYSEPIAGFYTAELIPVFMGVRVSIKMVDVQIPASAMTTVNSILDVNEVDHLFSKKSLEVHEQMNIPAKMGILMHGTQGTGKTTTMLAVADYLIKNYGAIAVTVSDHKTVSVAYDFIKKCRALNPNVMAVIVFDECEDSMSDYETDMKKLLDSNETPSNMIFLASTNYIEDIPETIKSRPSRFKHVIDCSHLNSEEDQIFNIFSAMNADLSDEHKLTDAQLKFITPNGVNKTIDELKHIFVQLASAPVVVTKSPKVKKATKTTSELS